MNICTDRTHRYREQNCGCQGGGGMAGQRTGSRGLPDANYYTNIWMAEQQGPTIAQGTLFSVL